ncbi:hypothetical protein, partial [Clostridium sp. HBUAS56010]|uniref:hypothetical protein n=1 Tax=Clostridium sp. HBUAS56010 TaxID=2571127 RepID=UPI001A9B4504
GETVHHRLFYDRAFSLVTFDAIGSTNGSSGINAAYPSAGSFGAPVKVAAAFHTAGQIMYCCCRIFIFQGAKERIEKPPHLLPR